MKLAIGSKNSSIKLVKKHRAPMNEKHRPSYHFISDQILRLRDMRRLQEFGQSKLRRPVLSSGARKKKPGAKSYFRQMRYR